MDFVAMRVELQIQFYRAVDFIFLWFFCAVRPILVRSYLEVFIFCFQSTPQFSGSFFYNTGTPVPVFLVADAGRVYLDPQKFVVIPQPVSVHVRTQL